MAYPQGAFANPYMNPYTNPFLNPYASLQPMSGRDAALSFLAAQQATGGLGSGQLSGVRPHARGGRRPSSPRTPNATTGVPGAAASGYFNGACRRPGGSRDHYNRSESYYPNFRR